MSKELELPVLRPVRVQAAVLQELRIERDLSLNDLPGFEDVLISAADESDFAVNMQAWFSQSKYKASALSLTLNGFFNVECQRCLGKLDIQVEQQSEYLLVNTEEDAELLTDVESDVLILGTQDTSTELRVGELDLYALIAEELMLHVPLYPRHENEQDCVSTDWVEYDAELLAQVEKNSGADTSEDKQKPFAGLNDLLKH